MNALTSSLDGQLPEDVDLRDRFAAACAKEAAPTATLIVQHDARVVRLTQERGAARVLEDDEPDDAALNLSCMQKQLTATYAIDVFRERGWSLDDEFVTLLREVMPGSFPHFAGITTRQLLASTHGLDDLGVDHYPLLADKRVDIVALHARLAAAPKLFPPGAAYSYSDLGALLVGALLERVRIARFETLLERELLPALGIRFRVDANAPDYHGYVCPTNGGSLCGTASDLLRLANWHLGTSPAAESSRAKLEDLRGKEIAFAGWTPFGITAAGPWQGYGSGWYGYNAATTYKHYSLLRFHPPSRTVIAVVSRDITAFNLYTTVLAGFIPDNLRIQPPQLFEMHPNDIPGQRERLAGTYVTAALAAEVTPTLAHQFAVTVRNRHASAPWLKAPIACSLRLAVEDRFFTLPVEPKHLSLGAFVSLPEAPGASFLWNTRRLWRKEITA